MSNNTGNTTRMMVLCPSRITWQCRSCLSKANNSWGKFCRSCQVPRKHTGVYIEEVTTEESKRVIATAAEAENIAYEAKSAISFAKFLKRAASRPNSSKIAGLAAIDAEDKARILADKAEEAKRIADTAAALAVDVETERFAGAYWCCTVCTFNNELDSSHCKLCFSGVHF